MKKKWETSYKWDLNRTEKAFDKMLRDNGFTILGVRMYISKTEYKLQKDDVVLEFSVAREATKPKLLWKWFEDYYNTCKEYHRITN